MVETVINELIWKFRKFVTAWSSKEVPIEEDGLDSGERSKTVLGITKCLTFEHLNTTVGEEKVYISVRKVPSDVCRGHGCNC